MPHGKGWDPLDWLCPPCSQRARPPLSPQRATPWRSCINMFSSCIPAQIKNAVDHSTLGQLCPLWRQRICPPPAVSTAGNSLLIIHRYVFVGYSPKPNMGSCSRSLYSGPPPRRVVSTAGNSVMIIYRCVCVGKSPKPDMGSCARCLHSRPAPPPCCLHNGELIDGRTLW